MDTIFLDFETLYDDEYSLRKMTPAEYILDPRFKANGCAVKTKDRSYWLDDHELQSFFDSLDPKTTSIVTFNALFDMCIVAWRYNFVPRLMIDVLGVCRAMLKHKLRSLSLANVSNHFNIGSKGHALLKVKGMDLAAIKAAGLYDEYTGYAINDNELCAQIYQKLVVENKFPPHELAIMDMVLRCAVEPKFILDDHVLAEHLGTIRQRKAELLAQAEAAGATGKSTLMSNQALADLLQQYGVSPPMKISPTTEEPTFAFAKTDKAFTALADHPNPNVQAIVAARLGHKSTLEESRCERLLAVGNLNWPAHVGTGKLLPMPLRYSGAHTHRLSGDWKLNVQNLPSRGGNNHIRRALTAPPGYKVVAADLAQIEARLVAWACGQDDLLDQFRRGEDVYCDFASEVFGKPVDKSMTYERFVGKTGVLQLGYQSGWEKFKDTIRINSGGETIMEDIDAIKVVNTYRKIKYPMISQTWNNLLYTAIPRLAGTGGYDFASCEFKAGEVVLPSGLSLYYDNLMQRDGDWVFTSAGSSKKLYGGALLENIIQALARIVVMDAAVRVQRNGFRIHLALQVHDELVYVSPDDTVEELKQLLYHEMKQPVAWAPTLPIEVEVGVGQNYGDAK